MKRSVLAFALLGGLTLNCSCVKRTGLGPLSAKEQAGIDKQKQILQEIIELYAKATLERPQDLVACAREMFAMRPSGICRDKFTHFLTPEEAEIKTQDDSNEFGGVGLEIHWEDGKTVVVSPLPGTPADRAGIKPKDVVTKIDGKEPKTLTQAVLWMRGDPGTKVKVTIERAGGASPIEYILKREDITVNPVESSLASANPEIGVIKVKRFQEKTYEFFESAMENLRQNGVQKVVIDLRNNPGGLVPSVLQMLGPFMKPDDLALTIRYRKTLESFGSKQITVSLLKSRWLLPRFGKYLDMKIVVLINSGSASASEIFSGTMKDWGYPIVGENSYGKGVGQNIFRLSDGSELALTTFEFTVGNHKVKIRDLGVTPTVEVKQPEGEKKDLQLEKAVELLKTM
jgi:carboxyl-terminal processing protease